MFPVSDGIGCSTRRYGKRGGVPVLFVHGGPGAGCSEDDKGFFDPDIFDVLLFEQRGFGRRARSGPETRSGILQSFDDGASMVSYIGHAGAFPELLRLYHLLADPASTALDFQLLPFGWHE